MDTTTEKEKRILDMIPVSLHATLKQELLEEIEKESKKEDPADIEADIKNWADKK